MANLNSDARDQAVVVGNPMIFNMPAPKSYASGNQTYTTGDILGGIIIHDGTGGATGTLPTAAALLAALPQPPAPRNGDTIECLIINGANASGTVTLAAGSGGGFDTNQGGGSRVILFGTSKFVLIRFTNTTIGSEAYVIYS